MIKQFILTLFITAIFCTNTIYSQRIYAYKLNDLDFGDIFIGYSSEVQQTDNNAAKFVFFHLKFFRGNIQANLSLPASLVNGKYKIPVKFDSRHSAWSYRDRVDGRKNFDPYAPLTLRNLRILRPVYIWLGGTLNTIQGNAPGKYEGTIILTLEIF